MPKQCDTNCDENVGYINCIELGTPVKLNSQKVTNPFPHFMKTSLLIVY